MSNAMMEAPPKATSLAGIKQRNIAAECFKAGTATVDQILLLADTPPATIDGMAADMNGVRHNQGKAGTPAEFQAAKVQRDEAADHAKALRVANAPKIEAARKQLAKLESEVAQAEQEAERAKNAFVVRQNARQMLATRLLPVEVQRLIQQAERPIRKQFSEELRAARYAASTVPTGPDYAGKMEAAQATLQDVEARMEAELAKVTQDLRDFWFVDQD